MTRLAHPSRILLLGILSSLAAACGGSSNGADTPPAEVPDGGAEGPETGSDAVVGACEVPTWAVDFFTRYATAACDGFAGCCTAANMSFEADYCVSAWVSMAETMIAPSFCRELKYDAAAADECIAAVTAYALTCEEVSPLYDAIDGPCGRAVSGQSQPGEPCDTNLDCAQLPDGPSICLQWSTIHTDGGTESGTLCQQAVVRGEGEPCANDSSNEPVVGKCAAGLWCDTGDTGTCVAQFGVGDPCTWQNGNDACPAGTYCSDTCNERPPIGSACADGACVESAYCDSSNMCIALAADGASCNSSLECASHKCSQGTCAPGSALLGFMGLAQCIP